ncbi:triose-phosphate isomerase [Entomomonas sp. E2T0]|uniref:triose-phosphate isomerase n=1 Tax=Entomomonas sp. E2T0 TaxID=2930213 RepID=UPI00222811C1|nr:triose-phosphate isomerase [Entomomonas sp. E2T0]UYZ83752.1 triose-phosphate isomerase [Entomomonas sp. E2T0]
MRRLLVAGNWKMHGNSASVKALLAGLVNLTWQQQVDIAVFPPALFIVEAVQSLKDTPIIIGAQDCAIESKEAALTGEIAASQLVDVGCQLVLIGHSERRLLLGDTDSILIEKFKAAQAQQLKPVLCIGETQQQRENNQTFAVITSQLNSIMDTLSIDVLANAIIAYEPVWAIGTGLTATPEQAQEVHSFIRSLIAEKNEAIAQKIQILYGGSVKADNAQALFAMPDIDGGLIGGASLNADEFGAIYRIAGNK